MATNGHDHLERVVFPPDHLDMRTTEGNNNNNNNNNNTNPVFGVWDYLFNAVFYFFTSGYEEIILRYRWKLIEFFFLFKVNFCFIPKVKNYNLCFLILGCFVIYFAGLCAHTFITNASQSLIRTRKRLMAKRRYTPSGDYSKFSKQPFRTNRRV